jgi:hypothetical protein
MDLSKVTPEEWIAYYERGRTAPEMPKIGELAPVTDFTGFKGYSNPPEGIADVGIGESKGAEGVVGMQSKPATPEGELDKKLTIIFGGDKKAEAPASTMTGYPGTIPTNMTGYKPEMADYGDGIPLNLMRQGRR